MVLLGAPAETTLAVVGITLLSSVPGALGAQALDPRSSNPRGHFDIGLRKK